MERPILITGGLGFIGSGIALRALQERKPVYIIDIEDKPEVVARLRKQAESSRTMLKIIRKDLSTLQPFEMEALKDVEWVIHCAAFKSIEESLEQPMKYLRNNINSTLAILNWCSVHNIRKVIFSSTAALYPIDKFHCVEGDYIGVKPTDAYGASKAYCEEFLESFSRAQKNTKVVILRYFNPIGSYQGLSEDYSDSMFGNAFRCIQENHTFTIFGNDYPTGDGTCVRDFIDLRDLIDAHFTIMKSQSQLKPFNIYNVGTGVGTSIKIACETLKSVFGDKFNFVYGPRRKGDSPAGVAVTEKILEEIGWRAQFSLEDTLREYKVLHKIKD